MAEKGNAAAGRAFAAGIVLAAALAGAGLAQDMPADPAAFTEAVAKIYREGPEGVEARIVGPLELEVRSAEREEKVYLNTVFSLCLRDRAACAGFLARNVDAMKVGLHPHGAPPPQDIRITVRPSAYLDDLMAAKPAGQAAVAEPLVDDLWMLGVRDEPTTIETLGQSDLDALKLSPDQALALGKRNLEGLVRRVIGDAAARGAAGVQAFRGSDYTSSLLAFPELWEPLAEKFDGQLFVAVPASDVVLFVDGRGSASRADMLQALNTAAARAKRPISPVVFEWTPSGWNKIAAVRTWPP